MKEEEKRKKDIFILEETYPNIMNIFTREIKPLTQLTVDQIFILDTNTLLMPYKMGRQSLEEIKKIYKTIAEKKHLFLPSRVVREFAKNRPNKIGEIYQQLLSKKSKFNGIQEGRYPLFENLVEYKELLELENKIESNLNEYKEKLDKLIDFIKTWNWNDPVTLAYSEIFDEECIIDLDLNKESLLEELRKRIDNKIPPGYKDSSKDDSGIGDLLIWKTILEIGKTKNSDVIFVSTDLKADWWHQSQGSNLYPRYELQYEFFNYTSGKTLYIIQLSKLLESFKVSKSIIEEVESQEIEGEDQNQSDSNNETVRIKDILDVITRENFPGRFTSIDVLRILSTRKIKSDDSDLNFIETFLRETNWRIGLNPLGNKTDYDDYGNYLTIGEFCIY